MQCHVREGTPGKILDITRIIKLCNLSCSFFLKKINEMMSSRGYKVVLKTEMSLAGDARMITAGGWFSFS